MIDTTATPIVINATRVSYEDQANPLKTGTVVGSTSSAWGTQYAIMWDGTTGDVLDYSDLRQAGWQHLGTPYRVGVVGSDPAALTPAGELSTATVQAVALLTTTALVGKLTTEELERRLELFEDYDTDPINAAAVRVERELEAREMWGDEDGRVRESVGNYR